MKPLTILALSFTFAVVSLAEPAPQTGLSPATSSAPAALTLPMAAGEATPVGTWAWQHNAKTVPIYADGRVGDGRDKGAWKWLDQTERTLQIDWESGWIDKLAIASDGQSMEAVNNLGNRFTVHLQSPAAASAAAAPVPTVEANAVGIWAWQYNTRTVFVQADGTIGKDHLEGTWKWKDQAARTFELVWKSGRVDQITIDRDGKSMRVVNTTGGSFTARLLPPTNDYEAPTSE